MVPKTKRHPKNNIKNHFILTTLFRKKNTNGAQERRGNGKWKETYFRNSSTKHIYVEERERESGEEIHKCGQMEYGWYLRGEEGGSLTKVPRMILVAIDTSTSKGQTAHQTH